MDGWKKDAPFNLNPWFLSFIILLIIAAPATAFQKMLTINHEEKIKKIAQIFTEELINRKIKNVIIHDFVDLKGRTGHFERKLTEKFRKALIKAKKGRFKILTKDAEVIIRGTVIPYAERDRFDLKIELIKGNEVIFTYTGIFK